jgi:hypothetical protein
MGIFNRFKNKDLKDDSNPFSRKADESLYQQALQELESDSINKGVYAKALADSSGDEAKAHSLYIKYRVQSLLDEQRGKAERLGIELTSKAKAKKIKDKEDAKRQQDKDWEETHWFTKIIAYIISAAILIPAWFWFSTKFLGM